MILSKGNSQVKDLLKKNGIAYWEIARIFGCSDMTIGRKLRGELSADDSKRFNAAISQILSERSASGLKGGDENAEAH